MALQWKSGAGTDLPNGGTKGQALVKKSNANQDVEWGDAAGNTESMELTQAQYDALTPEEKNNGTIYFITDGQGGGSYVLPPATASTLGGIKVGSGLSVAVDGTLSATGGSGGGDANFEIDEQYNMANVNNNVQYLSMDFNDSDTLGVAAYNPGTYMASRTLATKDYVDAHATEYTAGENIAIDANNVISANGFYADRESVTLWTGATNGIEITATSLAGNWNDYDELELWGEFPTSGGPLIGPVTLLTKFDPSLLTLDTRFCAFSSSMNLSSSSNPDIRCPKVWLKKTGDNKMMLQGVSAGIGFDIKEIRGVRYTNLGAVVGSVTQNGNNVPIVNNAISFNTPRAISTRMDGEITGMRVVEDGGSMPASITFNKNIDGVQVIMEDEAERLNTVLVDKDTAQTLTSPNGTKYKLTVANDGTLSAVAI